MKPFFIVLIFAILDVVHHALQGSPYPPRTFEYVMFWYILEIWEKRNA
jgi:hypothetical protein